MNFINFSCFNFCPKIFPWNHNPYTTFFHSKITPVDEIIFVTVIDTLRLSCYSSILRKASHYIIHKISFTYITRSYYRTVPSAIWEIFSEFLILYNVFNEPLFE